MTTTSTKPEALLWIDVETTGPDRTTAQILEIGMACTDSTATQDYGAFHAIVKPDILDISRITPWAWEHHTANGLIAEVRAASTRQNGPAAVGNAAEEYLESLEQRFQLVPTGTNVDFDLGFLGLLAIDTSPLSRRKLDLTTIRRLVAILGAPDLQPGDSIEPGHSRDNYDDCPICRARREKGADAIEGTGHPEQVYCTRYRDYAALYASMYGKGDVYQVRPVGELEASDEDFDGCYRCDRLVIVRAVERHVTLTPKRRRKVIRLMQRLDDGPCINPLPRNATPQMVEKFIQRSAADTMHIMRQAERSIR